MLDTAACGWDGDIAQCAPQVSCNTRGTRCLGVAKHEDELLTAKSHGCIPGTGDAPQLGCDPLQHGVSRGMATAVVDALEVVEVDEHDAQWHAPPPAVGNLELTRLAQPAAVVETGETIGHRAPRQLLVELGVVPGHRGGVAEQRRGLEVLVGESIEAHAPAVEHAELVVSCEERDEQQRLVLKRRVRHCSRCRVRTRIAEILWRAKREGPSIDAHGKREHVSHDLGRLASRGERGDEAMMVVIRLVDGEVVDGDDALQLLGDGRENALRIVLRLQRERRARQGMGKALRCRQCRVRFAP